MQLFFLQILRLLQVSDTLTKNRRFPHFSDKFITIMKKLASGFRTVTTHSSKESLAWCRKNYSQKDKRLYNFI